uniref:Uncharacterized protein n=1 Tax=Oryza rufipogon TaxID=4529 RepID=A0A0E0PGQ9_ORYRU
MAVERNVTAAAAMASLVLLMLSTTATARRARHGPPGELPPIRTPPPPSVISGPRVSPVLRSVPTGPNPITSDPPPPPPSHERFQADEDKGVLFPSKPRGHVPPSGPSKPPPSYHLS